MEYNIYRKNNKYYTGAERKIGLTVGAENYIIKFRKKTGFGIRNNHISEYLGCKIIESMGLNVQKVFLGTYNGEEIVAIRDFVENNQQFVAFNDVGESSIEEDKENFKYTYEGIMEILYANNKLDDCKKTIQQFWEIYVVDAILGNFDRHGGNWGFIKEKNVYSLAPIFDNGSCLFPSFTDEKEMKNIMNNQEETKKRVYTFPTSQILLNNQKSSYYEIIYSLEYKECNYAVNRIHSRFNKEVIDKIIDDTEFISETQKRFYKHMIINRFSLIIKSAYERLVKNEKASN